MNNDHQIFRLHDPNMKKIVEFHTHGNSVQYRAYNEDATLNSNNEISFQMKQGDDNFPAYSLFFIAFDGGMYDIETHLARSVYRILRQNGFAT